MSKCPKCEAGPAGVEGHGDLFTHSMTGTIMQFRCKACGSIWLRRYASDGRFAWAAPDGEHSGVALPTSSDRA